LRVFDLKQARKFLEIIQGHRLEALFSLALCLGPRQSEVLGLKWKNLQLDFGQLRIDGAPETH
jgi:integrase